METFRSLLAILVGDFNGADQEMLMVEPEMPTRDKNKPKQACCLCLNQSQDGATVESVNLNNLKRILSRESRTAH